MAEPTRWVTETKDDHSQWYIDRFRRTAAQGEDLVGEARLVDAMVPRQARILDAGCGTGRLSGDLHQRGHAVVGVDADPELIAAAAQDHPGPSYAVVDLTELHLDALGMDQPFDAVLAAGNVMVFLAPGTETQVLRRLRACLTAEGFIILGFHVDRHLKLTDFDQYVAEAGLRVEHRFATWDLKAWHDDADFAVTVLRQSRS
ncbi:class I SAM-dependent methyltransferase [Nesterenkonia xinjiangensis]|uniref:2-polyprenyl-3-methyl-5-hydroxy-6-metoxy-1, 4-benzoquinol methylase n=1 Tax=Nesterenkonia xinjiangensis TaxID=225327 RepID=A0A7Z0GIX7_9MICC|nr:class I SAM-dependent methyltransferase [Nesterenkonia xinjiangensis]NYJ76812.1 2-polyprenyl-3-methyl-5-hydroxy-6-metoxy-1,4-benzoquinol methylase [Nesterenkonia xinjiangensis]